MADEARRYVDAYTLLGEHWRDFEPDRKFHRRNIETAVCAFLEAAVAKASYTRPESMKGAMFMLAVVASLANDAECAATKGNETGVSEAVKGIHRALAGLAEFLERETGVSGKDGCLDFFIASRSAFSFLDEALEFLAAKKAA